VRRRQALLQLLISSATLGCRVGLRVERCALSSAVLLRVMAELFTISCYANPTPGWAAPTCASKHMCLHADKQCLSTWSTWGFCVPAMLLWCRSATQTR
jgi:hypothetical protein